MKTDPHEYAFPQPNVDEAGNGLTIREYFACHVLAGFAADPSQCLENGESFKDFQERITNAAVGWADALVAALDKPKES
jgi:hypothetical protein